MAVRRVELTPGEVWWAEPDPAVGREQAGRRPVVVVANEAYLDLVTHLALAVPVTSTDRGWPNHIPLGGANGLPASSVAMAEQVRAISRDRLFERAGEVSPDCLAELRAWIQDFLDGSDEEPVRG